MHSASVAFSWQEDKNEEIKNQIYFWTYERVSGVVGLKITQSLMYLLVNRTSTDLKTFFLICENKPTVWHAEKFLSWHYEKNGTLRLEGCLPLPYGTKLYHAIIILQAA